MRIAIVSLVLGLLIYPIAYNVAMSNYAEIMGGGFALSIPIYIVLQLGWTIWRRMFRARAG